MLLVSRCTFKIFPYISSQITQHHYFLKYANTPKSVVLLCEFYNIAVIKLYVLALTVKLHG